MFHDTLTAVMKKQKVAITTALLQREGYSAVFLC